MPVTLVHLNNKKKKSCCCFPFSLPNIIGWAWSLAMHKVKYTSTNKHMTLVLRDRYFSNGVEGKPSWNIYSILRLHQASQRVVSTILPGDLVCSVSSLPKPPVHNTYLPPLMMMD